MSNRFDLVVVGGGPGGYVAAIRAAQLGLDTAVIDENEEKGGTCLRVGCIPSKALLESSHLFVEARDHMAEHGIAASLVELNIATMMQRKTKVVKTLTGGIKMLLKKNGVKSITGRGRLKGNGEIEVTGPDKETIQADKILLATGSIPMMLPGIEFDDHFVGDSTTALSYSKVPGKLVVIGGGYIGLELGSVWARLGAEVVVLEAMDNVLGGLDQEIARMARRTFEKQGIQFHTGMYVESARHDGTDCIVTCKGAEPIQCDRVLLATGRVPNTKDIGLESANIATNQKGFIEVNETFETSTPGIFAVGDCVGDPMLAHKASEEGIACVENIVTGYGHVDYNTIPAIIYTHPEIASVGKTEEQLKAEGHEYKKGVSPFGANGRARALGATDGKIKILADQNTDRILGVHAIGAQAGDLIAEAAVAMSFGASSEDLARCCHAHPTLSEIMQEAAMAVDGRAIHS
ncbi:MAG: dihydrolipoyl dehydrogenase [Mariniblastus sp.]|nr:dihydrolipoyl dehydrogenase [Mariniblastus sp.]